MADQIDLERRPITRSKMRDIKKQFLRAAIGIQHQDCLIWPYTALDTGYGYFWQDGKRITAHRYVCEAVHGAANGLMATHNCGVKLCVNPWHIEWATAKKNVRDKALHGTQPQGESHCRAVLTEDQVIDVLARFYAGERVTHIARSLGRSRLTVSNIVHGRNWKHITRRARNG